MINWEIKELSELCLKAVDCVNKTAPLAEKKTIYKMLRTTNIRNGFIDFENVRYVDKDIYEKWTRRVKPIYGDVVFTREAPVGEVGRFTSKEGNFFLGQRTFLYRPDPKKLDWNFLAYLLQSPQIQGWVNGIAYGATVPHLKVGDMENLRIPTPNLSIQIEIARILSKYDDLIENNIKKINLLEHKAHTTYQKWFISMKFPGYKSTFIDLKTGLPKGWSSQFFSDNVDLIKGFEPGASSYENENNPNMVPFLRVGDLSKRNSDLFISKKEKNLRLASYRDVLLTLDGSPGQVKFGLSGAYSSGIRKASIKNKLFSPIFVYCYLKSSPIQFLINAHATGTTILHAGSCVKYMKINLPNEELLKLFNQRMMPIYELILNLLDQNKLLLEARNILLPRLMEGTMNLEDYKNLNIRINK